MFNVLGVLVAVIVNPLTVELDPVPVVLVVGLGTARIPGKRISPSPASTPSVRPNPVLLLPLNRKPRSSQ